MLEESKDQIIEASNKLRKIAIGGTAVGTGLNCPEGFDKLCCEEISKLTKETSKERKCVW